MQASIIKALLIAILSGLFVQTVFAAPAARLSRQMCWLIDGDPLELSLSSTKARYIAVNGALLQDVGDPVPDVNPFVGTLTFKDSANTVIIHGSLSEVDDVIVPSVLHLILDRDSLEGNWEILISETIDGVNYDLVRDNGVATRISCPD